jgi:hypothetical protein
LKLDCEQKEIRPGDSGAIHCKGAYFRLLYSEYYLFICLLSALASTMDSGQKPVIIPHTVWNRKTGWVNDREKFMTVSYGSW